MKYKEVWEVNGNFLGFLGMVQGILVQNRRGFYLRFMESFLQGENLYFDIIVLDFGEMYSLFYMI